MFVIAPIDVYKRQRLGWPLKMEAFAQPWTEKNPEESDIHTIRLRFCFESEIGRASCRERV